MNRVCCVRYLYYILWGIYLVALGWVLFFIHTPSFVRTSLRLQDVSPQWVPFRSILHYLTADVSADNVYLFFSNVVGNILLFVPWGWLAAGTWGGRRRGRYVGGSALLASTAAELLQYTLRRGVLDVDDVLLNTVGALLGYQLWVRGKEWAAVRFKG